MSARPFVLLDSESQIRVYGFTCSSLFFDLLASSRLFLTRHEQQQTEAYVTVAKVLTPILVIAVWQHNIDPPPNRVTSLSSRLHQPPSYQFPCSKAHSKMTNLVGQKEDNWQNDIAYAVENL